MNTGERARKPRKAAGKMRPARGDRSSRKGEAAPPGTDQNSEQVLRQDDRREAAASGAPQNAANQPPKPTLVGIGASAGGLAALTTFFSRVPPDSGLTFVVVVHLSPEHKSVLAELLQPHCPIPVQQVTENVALQPNHVYVIPPNANLSTIDTHLRLSELE